MVNNNIQTSKVRVFENSMASSSLKVSKLVKNLDLGPQFWCEVRGWSGRDVLSIDGRAGGDGDGDGGRRGGRFTTILDRSFEAAHHRKNYFKPLNHG